MNDTLTKYSLALSGSLSCNCTEGSARQPGTTRTGPGIHTAAGAAGTARRAAADHRNSWIHQGNRADVEVFTHHAHAEGTPSDSSGFS